MKKLTLALICAGILTTALTFADSLSFVIPANTTTNIFPAPIKITRVSILATNQVTLSIYDAPSTSFTNIVGSYSNLTQYATNVSIIYTNYWGVGTTNWLTNALVTATNSVSARTNTYPLIFTQIVQSNTTANLPNLGLTFVNGVMLTNASANTATITLDYTGN